MGMLRTAAVFSDHMVFQRGKTINVWGTDVKGREITLEFRGISVKAICHEHSWKAVLPPCGEYESGLTLKISDGTEELVFTDIAVGEVWLAGGQSNMEYELQNCTGGRDELKICGNTNVRFYYTKKNAYFDDYFYADEENSAWQLPSEETAACWSAVGYFFAKELSEKLGCTVGVIGCNWGGTSASAWISTDTLLTDPDTAEYVKDLENAMLGKTMEDYLRERDDYFAWEEKWQPKIEEYYCLHPTDGNWHDAQEYAGGPSRYPEPLGPMSPFRAGGLYETMLKRVMPYTLGGVIYYQGESDDHRPDTYYKLLKMLIEEWRGLSGDPDLPFVYTQLPFYIDESDEDKKNWCLIREAQSRVNKMINNTALAVTLELGEFHEIHPRDKVPYAHRLALQALWKFYGRVSAEEANPPVYKSHYYTDGGIMIDFNYSDGLCLTGNEGFEIAGRDGVYHAASPEIRDGKLFLSSEEVPCPISARYAWYNYGKATLFGGNGLSASPFRIV